MAKGNRWRTEGRWSTVDGGGQTVKHEGGMMDLKVACLRKTKLTAKTGVYKERQNHTNVSSPPSYVSLANKRKTNFTGPPTTFYPPHIQSPTRDSPAPPHQGTLPLPNKGLSRSTNGCGFTGDSTGTNERAIDSVRTSGRLRMNGR